MTASERSTSLSSTRRARAGARASISVGYDGCSASSVEAEVKDRLQVYMNGFMNDPALDGREGYPRSRATWPAADGSETDAWNSPLAHREFFDWQVRSSGGRSASGAPCMDVGALRNLISAIGMDLEVTCYGTSHDVAEGIAHAMDKGADDDCVTWPEYLNSMFAIGPLSDEGRPKVDPTEAGAKEGGIGLLRIPLPTPRDGVLRITLPKDSATGKSPPKDVASPSTWSGTTTALVAGGVVLAGAIAWKVLL